MVFITLAKAADCIQASTMFSSNMLRWNGNGPVIEFILSICKLMQDNPFSHFVFCCWHTCVIPGKNICSLFWHHSSNMEYQINLKIWKDMTRSIIRLCQKSVVIVIIWQSWFNQPMSHTKINTSFYQCICLRQQLLSQQWRYMPYNVPTWTTNNVNSVLSHTYRVLWQ